MMNYIKDMITDYANGTIIFFLQTEGEPEIWYWEVPKYEVKTNNFLEFVNDERNANLGCSGGYYDTLEEAKADALCFREV